MKILIVASIQADCFYEEKYFTPILAEELKKKGHEVDYIFLPFYKDSLALIEQIVAYSTLEVDCADMLITVGYPACFIPHDNKVIYLMDRLPRFFEYYNSQYGVLDTPQYSRIKSNVINIEKECFSSCFKLICNSNILQKDIKECHNIDSYIAYLPVINIDTTYNIDDKLKEPYIIKESYLLPEERLEIIFEAIKSSKFNIVLSVPRTSKLYRQTLDLQIKDYDIEDKVMIIDGFVNDNVYKNASYYISMTYETRRISNGILRALNNNCKIILGSDVSAENEITKGSYVSVVNPVSRDLIKFLDNNSSSDKIDSKSAIPNIDSIISVIGV